MAAMDSEHHTKELVLTREAVRGCDTAAIERYAMEGIVLMENAGGAAARYADGLLGGKPGAKVCVLAGTGNNGGDGFVAARHLYNLGYRVEVLVLGERERIRGDALSNLRIIERMELPLFYPAGQPAAVERELEARAGDGDLLVDALLGTGTAGPAREPIRTAIAVINRLGRPVLALDIPSGLDCDTGQPLGEAVRAGYTVTFAALKKGFENPMAREYTGKVTVASIGIKTELLLA